MNPRRSLMSKNFDISQESYDSGWTMPYVHYHNSYEIYILSSGTRTVTIDNKEYTADAHDATLFDKNIPHTSRGSTPFSGICIHMLDRFLDFYFQPSAKQQLLECFRHTVIHLNEEEYHAVKFITDHFIINDSDNFIKLVKIMDILNRAALRSSDFLPVKKNEPSTKAQHIIEYVNTNYLFIKSIAQIAEIFTISESYIFKIFQKIYHTTPKQYINSLRLKNACHLLKNRDSTIKSVAFNSGFDCYEYFIRIFKKEMGCTPSQYRKKMKA
jgi:AraC-like DNA-binding protein